MVHVNRLVPNVEAACFFYDIMTASIIILLLLSERVLPEKQITAHILPIKGLAEHFSPKGNIGVCGAKHRRVMDPGGTSQSHSGSRSCTVRTRTRLRSQLLPRGPFWVCQNSSSEVLRRPLVVLAAPPMWLCAHQVLPTGWVLGPSCHLCRWLVAPRHVW